MGGGIVGMQGIQTVMQQQMNQMSSNQMQQQMHNVQRKVGSICRV